MTDRDRDPAGRARNARPRDALGRPLPYGTAGEERAPEGVVRTPDRSLAEAQELLDAGRPFHAHEVLEDAWKSAPEARAAAVARAGAARRRPHPRRARQCAGCGDAAGPRCGNIAGYAAAPPHGIAVPRLAAWGRALAADAEAGRELDLRPPRLRA